MPLAEFDALVFPLVVAHRGASSTHPENTIAAFDAAVEAGADVVELDVRMTADGVPVVLHDANLSATTEGTGFVHQTSLADVKKLDASGGRGPRQQVPTLREAFEALSGRAGIDIEVKNIPGDQGFDAGREEAAESVVKLLDEFGFAGPVLVSSFNWLSIERVRQMAPDVATGFLTAAAMDPRAALRYVIEQNHLFVLPHVRALSEAGEAFVQEVHEAGVLVGTWTVDDPGDIQRLLSWGVDAVATNDPEAARPIRDAARAGIRPEG
jgi:glycerophosphoryl diester phosphodiesterase